mgnify:CR=1 FL=1
MTVDGLFVGVTLFAMGGVFVYLLREREVAAVTNARDALADVCTKQHMAWRKRTRRSLTLSSTSQTTVTPQQRSWGYDSH